MATSIGLLPGLWRSPGMCTERVFSLKHRVVFRRDRRGREPWGFLADRAYRVELDLVPSKLRGEVEVWKKSSRFLVF